MKVEINILQIKCNKAECGNLARFVMSFGEKRQERIALCSNCTKELYKKLGQKLVPKSPDNMLNIKNKKGI